MPIKLANPHSEDVPGGSISYWRKSEGIEVASCKSEANIVLLRGIGGYPSIEYKWPEDEAKLNQQIDLLRLAFRVGQQHIKKELRQLLDIPSYSDLK